MFSLFLEFHISVKEASTGEMCLDSRLMTL